MRIMSEAAPQAAQSETRANHICPICARATAHALTQPPELDDRIAALAAANTPGWQVEMGLCSECLTRFSEARQALEALAAGGTTAILPTPLRLGAVDRFRGAGVTIAFLDSGFFAHPDLIEPETRILKYIDVTQRGARLRDLTRPDVSSWHGMMTSVVACGNGRLSDGLYRGLASEARLVLVKCGSVRRIRHDDIRRGLVWVLRNHKRYGIRVVNVSCGGDYEASYLRDGLSQAADEATRAGLLVVAAAGNHGNRPGHPLMPPASAPSVLTVGAIDDKNRLGLEGRDMYHSSYGPSIDGLQKPEVLAQGIWLAAPILPGTPTAAQAQLLAELAGAPDEHMGAILRAHVGVDAELDAAAPLAAPLLRQLVAVKVRDNQVISGSYKHVDGTSFAAPIVSAVAAQMLEANPKLKPSELKRILMTTARRLPHVAPERQGWGVVDPRAAVLEAVRLAEQPAGHRLS
jgi:serine protease AprX